MKKLRNFKCGHCHRQYEIFASDKQVNHKCECGKMALRTLSAPRYFDNTVGKSPSAK